MAVAGSGLRRQGKAKASRPSTTTTKESLPNARAPIALCHPTRLVPPRPARSSHLRAQPREPRPAVFNQPASSNKDAPPPCSCFPPPPPSAPRLVCPCSPARSLWSVPDPCCPRPRSRKLTKRVLSPPSLPPPLRPVRLHPARDLHRLGRPDADWQPFGQPQVALGRPARNSRRQGGHRALGRRRRQGRGGLHGPRTSAFTRSLLWSIAFGLPGGC